MVAPRIEYVLTFTQARLRKLVARMDHNRDGFVDTEELTSKFFAFQVKTKKMNSLVLCFGPST